MQTVKENKGPAVPSDYFGLGFDPKQAPCPVFHRFTAYRGEISPDFSYNFLGVRTDPAFTAGIRCKSDEDCVEMTDLLESVAEAKGQFVMIELGAGYGKWLVNAFMAVKNIAPQMACRLIGVEAEPTHFKWMKQHFQNNGVPAASGELICAAVSGQKGDADFYTGEPERWYGQAIASRGHEKRSIFRLDHWKDLFRRHFTKISMQWTDQDTGVHYDFKAKLRRVRTVQLEELLAAVDHVDLIDLDIQGEEFNVLNQARPFLNQKVKKVHIGTHSLKIEQDLRELFLSLGWTNIRDYPMGRKVETSFGPINFCDGVQTWRNPGL